MLFKSFLLVGAAVLTLSAYGTTTAIHDTTEKENTHQQDLTEAKAAEVGSTETLSGKYKIEGTENTFYVAESDKLSLVESGFNLTVPEQSILLPLEYMEGEDGLNSGKNFDGVYGVVNNGPGYVFYSDGTIDVVTTHEATVTEDSISFGGLSCTWKARGSKILIYNGDSKEPAITIVPVDE